MIKKEDLKEDEIYVLKPHLNYTDGLFIFKFKTRDFSIGFSKSINTSKNSKELITGHKNGYSGITSWYKDLRDATSEEKHWLNTCIQQDKFVSKDEAMKTFVKELTELPEKWCIEIIFEQFEIISYRGKRTKVIYTLENGSYWNDNKGLYLLPEVLNDSETFEIYSVINNEGNLFTKGDHVKSPTQKGIINNFKLSTDKNSIIAITSFQVQTGINIDKLEHYIEPKKKFNLNDSKFDEPILKFIEEETSLEKAERLYPIGTVFKSIYKEQFDIVSNNIYHENSYNKQIWIDAKYFNRVIYLKEKWAEIIGYEPQVGDKFEIKNRRISFLNHHMDEKYFIIQNFKGSWDNPNSIITFKSKSPFSNMIEQTVLLKNIKIIK